MQWYETEVRAVETALPSRPPPSPVVFYGSSSIRLWGSIAQDLQEPTVLNLGFGGSTLAACAYYFDRLVAPQKPRRLVLYAGDNDLGDGALPQDVLSSLRKLLSRMDQTLGLIPFTFLSIKTSPARWHLRDHIRQSNELVRKELAGRPCSNFIDVAKPLLDARGTPIEHFFAEDGLHLSHAGYQVWTRVLRGHHHEIFIEDSCRSDS